MSDEIVVVVSGGEPPRAEAARLVPAGAPVIAADGGLAHARALGLEVTTVVGDMDSVTKDTLNAAEEAGTRIVRHPAEKDATDLELALDAALELEPERVLVLAGDGGRLDHLLATCLLLGSPRFAGMQLDAEIGAAHVHVVHGEREIEGERGELLSLFALHGPAEGVRTEGLAYPLVDEMLDPGSTRGVSNVFVADIVRVTLERGVLLAIRLPASEEGSA